MKKILLIILLVLSISNAHAGSLEGKSYNLNKYAFGIQGDDILTPFDRMCFKVWFSSNCGVEFIFDGSIRDSALWRYYEFNQLYRLLYRFNLQDKGYLFSGIGLVYNIDSNYYDSTLSSRNSKLGINNFIGGEYFVWDKISLSLELSVSTSWTESTGSDKLAAEMLFKPYFFVYVYF